MEVWQTLRKNAEDGARQLVSEFGDRLLTAAAVLCRDDHLAEDLVFRTFDQAVKKIRQYHPTGDFYNWLYTILLNFWRMDVRKKKLNIVYMGATEDLPPTTYEVAPEPIGRASDEDVRRALDELPTQTRDVVVLKYFKGLPVEDISRLLDIPEGTVKSRLFNARKVLCAALSKTERNLLRKEVQND